VEAVEPARPARLGDHEPGDIALSKEDLATLETAFPPPTRRVPLALA